MDCPVIITVQVKLSVIHLYSHGREFGFPSNTADHLPPSTSLSKTDHLVRFLRIMPYKRISIINTVYNNLQT